MRPAKSLPQSKEPAESQPALSRHDTAKSQPQSTTASNLNVEATGSTARSQHSDDPQSGLTRSLQDVYGNTLMQGALAGLESGPGQAIEGAMVLGAAGVSIASDQGQLFSNGAVQGWMDSGLGVDASVQRDAAGEQFHPQADRKVQTAIGRGGRPLSPDVSARFGAAFGGVDFSAVRIHSDGAAAQASESINAYAFTVGTDIFFNQGTWNPQTPTGQHLLAHELTHVVQHLEGRLRPGGSGEGGLDVSSPTDSFELEAEDRAAEVTRALADISLDSDALADGATTQGEISTPSSDQHAPGQGPTSQAGIEQAQVQRRSDPDGQRTRPKTSAKPTGDDPLALLTSVFGDKNEAANAILDVLGGPLGGDIETPGVLGLVELLIGSLADQAAEAGADEKKKGTKPQWSIKKDPDHPDKGLRLEGALPAFLRDLLQVIITALSEGGDISVTGLLTRMSDLFPDLSDPDSDDATQDDHANTKSHKDSTDTPGNDPDGTEANTSKDQPAFDLEGIVGQISDGFTQLVGDDLGQLILRLLTSQLGTTDEQEEDESTPEGGDLATSLGELFPADVPPEILALLQDAYGSANTDETTDKPQVTPQSNGATGGTGGTEGTGGTGGTGGKPKNTPKATTTPSTTTTTPAGGGNVDGTALGASIKALSDQTSEAATKATPPKGLDANPKPDSEENHDKKVAQYQDGVDGVADQIEDLDAFDDLCDAVSDGDTAGQNAALARIKSDKMFKRLSQMWAGAMEGGKDQATLEAAFNEEFDGRGFWGSTEQAFNLVANAAKAQAKLDADAKNKKKKAQDAQGQAGEVLDSDTGGGDSASAAALAGAAGGAGGFDPALLNAVVAEHAAPIEGLDAVTSIGDQDFAQIADSMAHYQGMSEQYDQDGGRFSQVLEALSGGGGAFLETAGETAFIGILAHFGDKALGEVIGKVTGTTIPIVGPTIMLLMDPPWKAEYWDSMGSGIVEGWDSFKSAFDWGVFENAHSATDYIGLVCAKLADLFTGISAWLGQLMRIINTLSALAMFFGGAITLLGLALLWFFGVGAALLPIGGWLIDAGMVLGEISMAMLAIQVATSGLALIFRSAAALMVPAEVYAEQLGGVQEASEAFGHTAGAKVGLSASRAVEEATKPESHSPAESKQEPVEQGRIEGHEVVEGKASAVEEHVEALKEIQESTKVEESKTNEPSTEAKETGAKETGAKEPGFGKRFAKEFAKNMGKAVKDIVSVGRNINRVVEGVKDLGNINAPEGLRQVQSGLDEKVAQVNERVNQANEALKEISGKLTEAESQLRENVNEMTHEQLRETAAKLESLHSELEKMQKHANRLEDFQKRWQRTKEGADQKRYDGPETGKGELNAVEDEIRTKKSEVKETQERQTQLSEKLSQQEARIEELKRLQADHEAGKSERVEKVDNDPSLSNAKSAANDVDTHNAQLEAARQKVAELRRQGLDEQADFIEKTEILPSESMAEQRYWEGREQEATAWRDAHTKAQENPFDEQVKAAEAEHQATMEQLTEAIDKVDDNLHRISDLEKQARSGRIDKFTKRADEKWREHSVGLLGEAVLHQVEHLLAWIRGEHSEEKPKQGTPTAKKENKPSGGEGEHGNEEAKAHIEAIGRHEAALEELMHLAPPANLEVVKAARVTALQEAEQATERHAAAFQAYVAEQAVARMADDTAKLIEEGKPLRDQSKQMATPLAQSRADEDRRGSILKGANPDEVEGSDKRSGGLIDGLIQRLAEHSDDLSQVPDTGGANSGDLTKGQDEVSDKATEHTDASRGYSDQQAAILDEAISIRTGQETQLNANIADLEKKHTEEQGILTEIQGRKAQALSEEQAHRSEAASQAQTFSEGYEMLRTWSIAYDEKRSSVAGGGDAK